jgi:hypothetical protein
MKKFPSLKYDQDNLDLMSCEKELVTDETHNVNAFYGQSYILRKYAGYSKPIKAVYEHSLPFHDIIWEIDQASVLKVAFVSSAHRYGVYKKQKAKPIVFNIGSILNYAIAMEDPVFAKNNFKSSDKREGSIYFPSHSTHHIKSNVNTDEVISKILKLPNVYQPVCVCLYWKDIQNGEHHKYIEKGIKVVSAGHIYDNLFYFRLYDILKNFKYTLGSSFGSFIFHAARSGSLVVIPEELKIIEEDYSISTEQFEDKDFRKRTEMVRNFNHVVADLFKQHVNLFILHRDNLQRLNTY